MNSKTFHIMYVPPYASVYHDPVWVALYLKFAAVGGPVPGVVPHGPLTQATFSVQLLEQVALSTPNARHKESLLTIAKDIFAEATKAVTQ